MHGRHRLWSLQSTVRAEANKLTSDFFPGDLEGQKVREVHCSTGQINPVVGPGQVTLLFPLPELDLKPGTAFGH